MLALEDGLKGLSDCALCPLGQPFGSNGVEDEGMRVKQDHCLRPSVPPSG